MIGSTATVEVIDPVFGNKRPLAGCNQGYLDSIEIRHFALAIRGHQHPQAGAWHVMADPITQRLQYPHLIITGNQAGMYQSNGRSRFIMSVTISGVTSFTKYSSCANRRRLWSRRLLRIGPSRELVLDRLCSQPLEQKVVKRDPIHDPPLLIEPPQEVGFAGPHIAGLDRQHEEATRSIGMLQPIFIGPGLNRLWCRGIDVPG